MILGVDPGLNITGYGVISLQAERMELVAAGDIRPPKSRPLAERLQALHAALCDVIARYRPSVAVLEKIFVHHGHVTTAALMAHARGVVCLAVQERGIELAEYLPTHIKKSLTGRGQASKDQVARMVGQWVSVEAGWSSDATDALALAIVHAHHAIQRRNLAGLVR